VETVYWYKSGGQLRIQCVSADDNLVPRVLLKRSAVPPQDAPEPVRELLEADSHGALTWAEMPGLLGPA
jgi:hypothetical protein